LTAVARDGTLEATTYANRRSGTLAKCARATAAGIQWRTSMAKALLGHLGGPDPRLLSEMRRLQERIRDLEYECLRLQAANDALSAEASHDELLTLSVPEPQPV
jgi:hypothetical protein